MEGMSMIREQRLCATEYGNALCRICNTEFRKTNKNQEVCAKPACQRTRRLTAQRKWRDRQK
jgi:hypothetical protein